VVLGVVVVPVAPCERTGSSRQKRMIGAPIKMAGLMLMMMMIEVESEACRWRPSSISMEADE
jgi:hypothetical protein